MKYNQIFLLAVAFVISCAPKTATTTSSDAIVTKKTQTTTVASVTTTTSTTSSFTVTTASGLGSTDTTTDTDSTQTDTLSGSSTTTTTGTSTSTSTKTVVFHPAINVCTLTEPCQNAGACSNSFQESENSTSITVTMFPGAFGFYCGCPTGIAGIYCELDSSNCSVGSGFECLNGGFCRVTPTHGECVCPDGVSGAQCDQFPAASNCIASCQNGGFCNDSSNACQCPDGFMGTNCEITLAAQTATLCSSVTCQNGGFCFLDAAQNLGCACTNDYYGARCEYRR